MTRLWPDSKHGAGVTATLAPGSVHDDNALRARCSATRLRQLANDSVDDRSAHFFKITGFLKGDGFNLDEALALWRAFPEGAGVAKWGYGDKLATELTRVWAKVSDEPRDERSQEYQPPGGQPQAVQPRRGDAKIGDELITEDSVALMFATLYRNRLRYCHDTGGWFEWTGTVWKKDRTGGAFAFARQLVRDLSKASRTSFVL